MSAEVRMRRSRGSSEVQTGHSQPIIGTPVDVPVPRSVIRIMSLDARGNVRATQIGRPQVGAWQWHAPL